MALRDHHCDNSTLTKGNHDEKTAEEKAITAPIYYGPWGGAGGEAWDDESGYTGVREIIIASHTCINSICVVYDKNGKPVEGKKHGGDGGSVQMVPINFPDEYLIGISGYCGYEYDVFVVRALTFITNKREIGPFGDKAYGTPFSSPENVGKVVGFAGRSGSYVDQIGVYTSKA